MIAGALVVGAGAAGLATALRLSTHMQVVLLCKAPIGSGAATAWAQGGIAAAMGEDDSPALHIRDTESVGGGLNDHHVVEILARDAADRIAELIALGAAFDRSGDGTLAFGQEAAHSRRRILHAGGDATGREVLRALVAAIRASSVRIVEGIADEVILERGIVGGVFAHRVLEDGTIERFRLDARAVVLATGGSGRLFRYTTNPLEATGDGIALAARAGADLVDLEFVQFHPTALAVGIDPMPLLTEALRGEGARVVDASGRPLMQGRDPRGDLAPRDVVARVVFEAAVDGLEPALDARHIDDIARRFPTVANVVRGAGLDASRDLLPIAPAAHYHMGGITVDDCGRTTLPGLWSCGETASTGAHGANRLASNSLLEALVFAARVADDIASVRGGGGLRSLSARVPQRFAPRRDDVQRAAMLTRLRDLMYRGVGVVRDGETLRRTIIELQTLTASLPPAPVAGALENMLLVGTLIAQAAEGRRESRGSHARRDFPASDVRFEHRAHARVAAATAAVTRAG